MRYFDRMLSAAILIMVVPLMLVSAGCFGSANQTESTSASPTPNVIQPKPQVESVTASTTGSGSDYAVILRVKVKNEGAEGTILIQASVAQNGAIEQDETPVYDLREGESREVVLKPFPLVWQGGAWKTNVQALVP